jgi:hypothetical protein
MSEKLSSEGLKAAADTTKQIITLSTGVIALTVTFLEKIVQPVAPSGSRSVPWTIFGAWIVFGLAIVAGVATLGAVSGSLDAMDRKQNGLSSCDHGEAGHFEWKGLDRSAESHPQRMPGAAVDPLQEVERTLARLKLD